MAKPEWGAKRICHNCGARFYDMRHEPIVCPKCSTPFDPEALLKSRRSRNPIIAEITAPKAAKKAPLDIAAAEVGGLTGFEEVELPTDEIVTEDDAEIEKGDADAEEFEEEEEVDEANPSSVLLEDASELGDEDVEDVIPIGEDDEEGR